MNNWRYKRSYRSESSIRVQVSNMSLVKSAFVLLSALLSQSCTQALPSSYEWIDVPQKQPDDVAPLSPTIDRSSPQSDFLAGKVLVIGSTFGESDEYNRQFSMLLKQYSEAHRKHSNFEHFSKFYHHNRRPVLIDPSVSSDLKPTESSVEGVSSPTVTNSPQPPVLSDRRWVFELGPMKANNGEEFAYLSAGGFQYPFPFHFGQLGLQLPTDYYYDGGESSYILRNAMELPDFNYPEDNNELQAAKPLY